MKINQNYGVHFCHDLSKIVQGVQRGSNPLCIAMDYLCEAMVFFQWSDILSTLGKISPWWWMEEDSSPTRDHKTWDPFAILLGILTHLCGICFRLKLSIVLWKRILATSDTILINI